ncbi:hypothetical protein [Actinomadura litoris]|uniref:hypothetical protein n=1 Tax=Actinomadura litoris TaxID=2678616 RepID=UPI001FA7E035|nr:hypothetical protein [Actinomadura litoris]
MTFRGVDHCLRCGRPLSASKLAYIGDCCIKRVTPAQLKAMAAYAAQVADPFHIPAPRPMSAEGRRNNANARAALQVGVVQVCRHDNRIGACGDCRREADPTRAAEMILRAVRAQTYAERRAERIAVQAARRDAGIPAPAARPAPRPSLRRTAEPKKPKRVTAHPTEQLELL